MKNKTTRKTATTTKNNKNNAEKTTAKKNVNFKISQTEWKKVVRLAEKHTKGNCSVWIRNRILSPLAAKSA